ncbi:hypothetical protein EDD85DRAFT_797438 [Armillaria nabsnona]|nr:hypothetical protein EDD85DRAFT_797438 [Armillaria nabsnona]
MHRPYEYFEYDGSLTDCDSGCASHAKQTNTSSGSSVPGGGKPVDPPNGTGQSGGQNTLITSAGSFTSSSDAIPILRCISPGQLLRHPAYSTPETPTGKSRHTFPAQKTGAPNPRLSFAAEDHAVAFGGGIKDPYLRKQCRDPQGGGRRAQLVMMGRRRVSSAIAGSVLFRLCCRKIYSMLERVFIIRPGASRDFPFTGNRILQGPDRDPQCTGSRMRFSERKSARKASGSVTCAMYESSPYGRSNGCADRKESSAGRVRPYTRNEQEHINKVSAELLPRGKPIQKPQALGIAEGSRSVRVLKKSIESNRRYERVTIKTEKPEYRHVLTHGPSRQIPDIHNRHLSFEINSADSGENGMIRQNRRVPTRKSNILGVMAQSSVQSRPEFRVKFRPCVWIGAQQETRQKDTAKNSSSFVDNYSPDIVTFYKLVTKMHGHSVSRKVEAKKSTA